MVSVSSAEDGATQAADVQFEAFQLSDQAVRLFQAGWFQAPEKLNGGSCILRNPKVRC